MNSEDDIVTNKSSGNLTYTTWYEHIMDAVSSHWKTFILYSLGGFGIFWGLIEASSFFFPDSNINNGIALSLLVVLSTIVALFRCIHDYSNVVPDGLENETKEVQKIARKKRHFWEYALAYELLKKRIKKTDQDLDDIINNRVHIRITKTMDVESYIHWIGTRPDNLLGMVESAKQLLIFDLFQAIHPINDEEIDLNNLVRIADLIGDLYRNAYDFEVEGREIKIPENFELVHEIQFGWVTVICDGFNQMLDILHSLSLRDKDNLEPVKAEIVFEEPPRMDEFFLELDKLEALFLDEY